MPGVSVQDQDPLMSDAMADFIIDAIIVTKVRNGGNASYMASDLKEKFESHFGGKWVVFITKDWDSDWDFSDGSSTYISVEHGAHLFLVMQTLQHPIG